ncbi:LytTR family transcriptional regulator DNA-binding domain-containing protein [Brevibacillus sp. NRS-1366]|uniref:LytTR family transcriptional regulator DNA-binding domain-containing protein n=1 Tax=Brevibacillus sp. NRS-1366 TaxID=3233899 RepID=UPI003D1CB884
MKIPLFRKGFEEEGIHWIDMTEEVTHLSHSKNKIEIHTKDDVYYMLTSLEDWRRVLKQYGFEKLDVGNIVNMKKITVFDESKQKVYFEDQPDSNSKYTDVARVHISKLNHIRRRKK